MSKLQTEFSFPTRLKLARYLAKGVDGRSLPGGGQYELHAVLSHEGDAGSGHYRAYVLGATATRISGTSLTIRA